jgi:glutamate-1-semialdehyde 2,1-aminomutase
VVDLNPWVLTAIAGGVAVAAPAARRRLELSAAKHRSLAGHPRIARWLAALIPHYEYDEHAFFRSDGAERGIPLIFDEVFVGFRLAPGGAQEYFGVRADLVTYGKTLGGGLPVGVVCGRANLMRRFDEDKPADVCFARGTFNAHPYVMASMNEFLVALEEQPELRALYAGLDDTWNRRAEVLNARLREAQVPVRVRNLATIWTVCYQQPSRYNWMLQFYLRAHGLTLSWVGTGRFIFSLNYSEHDFEEVMQRIVGAARDMATDGWWTTPPGLTNRAIQRKVLREMVRARIGLPPVNAAASPWTTARLAAGAAAPCDRA